MTPNEAQEKAKALWGTDVPEGHSGSTTGGIHENGTTFGKQVEVGVWHTAPGTRWFEAYGQGRSYEEAFHDAARRRSVATPARQ